MGDTGYGRTPWVIAICVCVVAALAAGAFVVVEQRRAEERRDVTAADAAQAFATAWTAGDLSGLGYTGAEAAAVQESFAATTAGLDGAAAEVSVASVERTDSTATADLDVTWAVGGQEWSYPTTAALSAAPDDLETWTVDYGPALVHPELAQGDLLDASPTAAERAEVLGRDGDAIVSQQPVVDVGVQPSAASDPAGLSQTLADLLDVDAAALLERIEAAQPDAFVPVITLRRADFDAVAEELRPLPGTVFAESTLPLAPTREFARALLGAVGPATAELVEESEGRLVGGAVTGLSGLQREYDEKLAGTPGVVVERVRGEERTELFSVAAAAGTPVQITLDAEVQQAADAALALSTQGNGNAALVAIDVPTGDVLAVANTPASGTNRALTGQYPPGSTFKVLSTQALLATGLDPAEIVPCPPTATVDGRSFKNFEGGSGGDQPFSADFAQSCNTAFVALSQRLEPDALQAAAAGVGLGGDWQIGTPAFTGSVPVTEGATELAAATIGQGRVLASPVAMAQAVAAIARGSWAPPRLVLEPPVEAPGTPAPPVADLGVVSGLMRGVVENGTASALGDVPGQPVHAKTGTAEYGSGDPLPTHAWTIGFRGTLAFAILVEDGASGGAAAVPVAETFLRSLPPA